MAGMSRADTLVCTLLIALAIAVQAFGFMMVDRSVSRSAGVLIERFMPKEGPPPTQDDERCFAVALGIMKRVHNGLWSLFALELTILAITAALLWHAHGKAKTANAVRTDEPTE